MASRGLPSAMRSQPLTAAARPCVLRACVAVRHAAGEVAWRQQAQGPHAIKACMWTRPTFQTSVSMGSAVVAIKNS